MNNRLAIAEGESDSALRQRQTGYAVIVDQLPALLPFPRITDAPCTCRVRETCTSSQLFYGRCDKLEDSSG